MFRSSRGHLLSRWGGIACIPLMALVVCLESARTYANESFHVQRQALVIGVDDFKQCPDIESAALDRRNISSQLTARCGYQVESIEAQRSRDTYFRIRQWTNSTKSARQVLLYYRGYVYVEGDDAYLAAADCDPSAPHTGDLSVTKIINQLANCGTVGNAFLVLDVGCPSGVEALTPVLRAAMEKLSDVETSVGVLAACLADGGLVRDGESPVIRSLSRGLTGQADTDFDGIVSFGEACVWTANSLTEDDKVLVMTSRDSVKLAELSRQRPVNLEEMINDLADELSVQLHGSQVQLIAVPDLTFSSPETGDATTPGSAGGPLARLCTKQLRSAISRRSGAQYKLVPEKELLRLLKVHDVGPETVQTNRMQKLGAALADLFDVDRVALLLGRVSHRGKQRLSLTCTPWDTANLQPMEPVVGRAFLTPSDWSLTGKSAVSPLVLNQFMKVDRSRIPANPPGALALPPKAHEDLDYFDQRDLQRSLTEIERLHANSETVHPLHADASPRFPFRVSIKVNGTTVAPQWSVDKRHMYVRLKQGDSYSIWINNQSESDVFMRLLVDGLNTLPDYPAGLPIDDHKPDQLKPAQAVSLTRARPWNCDPQRESVVAGFFTRFSGQTGELRKFEVVDVADSEASRNGYHQNIGVITAAFYAPMKKPAHKGPLADIGTRLGATDTTKVVSYRGKQAPGDLLGVVHIRYGIAP